MALAGSSMHRHLMLTLARGARAQEDSRAAIEICATCMAQARTSVSEARRARESRVRTEAFTFGQVDAHDRDRSG
jgi:hypothetical protein